MKLFDKVLSRFGRFIARRIKSDSSFWHWLSDSTGSNEGKFGRAMPGNYYKYLQGYADVGWVYKCVSAIATCAASVPIRLYRGKGKKKTEITEHVVLDLLERVNSYTTAYDLKEITFSNMEITGNQYWLLGKNLLNTAREIYLLRPDRVEIVPDKDKHILGYLYTINGIRVALTPDEVIHFKYFNPTDDYYGLSSISSIRAEADSEDYASRYNRNFFKNNARVDAVLETDQELDDAAYKRLRIDWENAHQGEGKEHGIAILEKGLKYTQSALTQKDMDFMNLRKLSRETICGIMGVKPAVVGLFEYASYANAEIQYKMFWQDTVIPKMIKYVGTLNEFLLPLFGDESLYFEPDYSNVEALKENEVQKTTIDTQLVASGLETINERRAKRGLDPVLWGDAWWAPFSLSPVSSSEPKPKPTPAPVTPAADGSGKSKKKGLAEAQKQKKWEIFAKFTENFEDKFKPILRKLFDDQEDEVLANLDKLKSVKAKIDIESILFDYDGAVAKFKRNGKPIMADVAAYSGNNELAQLNLPIAFDVENPRGVAFLKTAAMKFATEVNDTTIKALKATLSEGFAAGESIPDLAKRVQDVFDTASTSRATMIARTEVIEASNFGALESYAQLWIESTKQPEETQSS